MTGLGYGDLTPQTALGKAFVPFDVGRDVGGDTAFSTKSREVVGEVVVVGEVLLGRWLDFPMSIIRSAPK